MTAANVKRRFLRQDKMPLAWSLTPDEVVTRCQLGRLGLPDIERSPKPSKTKRVQLELCLKSNARTCTFRTLRLSDFAWSTECSIPILSFASDNVVVPD